MPDPENRPVDLDKGSRILCLVIFEAGREERVITFWCACEVVHTREIKMDKPALILGVRFTNWAILEPRRHGRSAGSTVRPPHGVLPIPSGSCIWIWYSANCSESMGRSRPLTRRHILDGGTEGLVPSGRGRCSGHDDEESLEKAILEARAEGEVEPDEESMLLGILRFNDLQVQDTMTPRTDIDCVPDDMPLPDVARIIVRSGHSRIPVYHETRDNIVGIVHAKDVLHSLLDAHNQNAQAADPPRPQSCANPFCTETKSIRTLLQEFRARKQHIAIALDEYGGTSGLITIEDVLEEIVGDIEDEHDAPRQEDIRPLGDGAYELTGRALLEDLEDMGINLDSDEVDTVGGYLSMEAGHVPAPGESFTLDGWTFTVLEADKKLILRLRMEPASKDEAALPPALPGYDPRPLLPLRRRGTLAGPAPFWLNPGIPAALVLLLARGPGLVGRQRPRPGAALRRGALSLPPAARRPSIG